VYVSVCVGVCACGKGGGVETEVNRTTVCAVYL